MEEVATAHLSEKSNNHPRGSRPLLEADNLSKRYEDAVVYGAAAMRNRTHTLGAGYTERAEIKGRALPSGFYFIGSRLGHKR